MKGLDDEDVEVILEMPAGPQRDEAIALLDDADRGLIARLDAVDEFVRDSLTSAPALALDPAAAILGLVPDASMQLDSAAFAQACRKRGLLPNALAESLRSRGWRVQPSDVFRWQTGGTSDVAPALILAVADLLAANPEELTSSSPSVLDRITAIVMATQQFDELVARFARAQQTSVDIARSALRTRMLATVHRGDEAEPEQMLASLEALVSTFEEV